MGLPFPDISHNGILPYGGPFVSDFPHGAIRFSRFTPFYCHTVCRGMDGETALHLPIHLLRGIWVVGTFWLLRTLLQSTFVCRLLSGHVFSSLGYIPRSGTAGPPGNSMFNFLRNRPTAFQSFASFYIPTSNAPGFQLLHILANPYFLVWFIMAIGGEVVSHRGGDLPFP